MATVNIFSKQ